MAAIQRLRNRPAAAALAGLALLIPLLAANAVVANRIEPFFGPVRPGPRISPGEYVLLAAVLLLMPAGGLIAMLPSLALDAGGWRRYYTANFVIAAILFIIFGVIPTALGSEVYYCGFLQVPNCD